MDKRRFTKATYQQANLRSCVPAYLKNNEKKQLLDLLFEYEHMFQGRRLPGKPVHIDIRPGAKPFHGRAFSVPKAYEKLLRDEIQRLLDLGVLRRANISEWAAPLFGVPKKNQQIRFVSDLRRLNEHIIRRPFPLPSIHETRRTLEGFTFCSALLSISTWDFGPFRSTSTLKNLHHHPPLGQVLLSQTSNGPRMLTRHLPGENVLPFH